VSSSDKALYCETRLTHVSPPVLSGVCVSAQSKGSACSSNADCTDPGVYCSPGGVCGGGQAQCEPNFSSPTEIGESDVCVSGEPFRIPPTSSRADVVSMYQGSARATTSARILDTRIWGASAAAITTVWIDTPSAATASVAAQAYTARPSQATIRPERPTIAHPVSHASPPLAYDSLMCLVLLEYCRNNVCSNVPRRNKGDSCAVDSDCTGYDQGIAFYCGTDGKCGGSGAACQANDRTAEGKSAYCVSGMFSVLWGALGYKALTCLLVA
jgi:hypothetical protein